LNVDAILIFDAYWAAAPPPSPAAQSRATCQPIIATAVGIGCRLPVPDTLRRIQRWYFVSRVSQMAARYVVNSADFRC